MPFVRVTAAQYKQAHARGLAEFVADGNPAGWPGEGAIESALRDTARNFIFRDSDFPRVSVWALRETGHRCYFNANAHVHIFVPYVLGDSTTRPRVLVRICDEAIARGWGNLLITYQRTGHPTTVLADTAATVPSEIEPDGRTVTTTAVKARARLIAAGYTA